MKNSGNVDFAKNFINSLILGLYLNRNEHFFNFKYFNNFFQLKIMEMLIFLKTLSIH